MATAEIPVQIKTATEAKTVADLAQQAFGSETLQPGKLYLVANAEGGVRQIDTYDYDARPRRKEDTNVHVSDAASFQAYLNKHGIGFETEITASVTEAWFNAVIKRRDRRPGWLGRPQHPAPSSGQRRMVQVGSGIRPAHGSGGVR